MSGAKMVLGTALAFQRRVIELLCPDALIHLCRQSPQVSKVAQRLKWDFAQTRLLLCLMSSYVSVCKFHHEVCALCFKCHPTQKETSPEVLGRSGEGVRESPRGSRGAELWTGDKPRGLNSQEGE